MNDKSVNLLLDDAQQNPRALDADTWRRLTNPKTAQSNTKQPYYTVKKEDATATQHTVEVKPLQLGLMPTDTTMWRWLEKIGYSFKNNVSVFGVNLSEAYRDNRLANAVRDNPVGRVLNDMYLVPDATEQSKTADLDRTINVIPNTPAGAIAAAVRASEFAAGNVQGHHMSTEAGQALEFVEKVFARAVHPIPNVIGFTTSISNAYLKVIPHNPAPITVEQEIRHAVETALYGDTGQNNGSLNEATQFDRLLSMYALGTIPAVPPNTAEQTLVKRIKADAENMGPVGKFMAHKAELCLFRNPGATAAQICTAAQSAAAEAITFNTMHMARVKAAEMICDAIPEQHSTLLGFEGLEKTRRAVTKPFGNDLFASPRKMADAPVCLQFAMEAVADAMPLAVADQLAIAHGGIAANAVANIGGTPGCPRHIRDAVTQAGLNPGATVADIITAAKMAAANAVARSLKLIAMTPNATVESREAAHIAEKAAELPNATPLLVAAAVAQVVKKRTKAEAEAVAAVTEAARADIQANIHRVANLPATATPAGLQAAIDNAHTAPDAQTAYNDIVAQVRLAGVDFNQVTYAMDRVCPVGVTNAIQAIRADATITEVQAAIAGAPNIDAKMIAAAQAPISDRDEQVIREAAGLVDPLGAGSPAMAINHFVHPRTGVGANRRRAAALSCLDGDVRTAINADMAQMPGGLTDYVAGVRNAPNVPDAIAAAVNQVWGPIGQAIIDARNPNHAITTANADEDDQVEAAREHIGEAVAANKTLHDVARAMDNYRRRPGPGGVTMAGLMAAAEQAAYTLIQRSVIAATPGEITRVLAAVAQQPNITNAVGQLTNKVDAAIIAAVNAAVPHALIETPGASPADVAGVQAAATSAAIRLIKDIARDHVVNVVNRTVRDLVVENVNKVGKELLQAAAEEASMTRTKKKIKEATSLFESSSMVAETAYLLDPLNVPPPPHVAWQFASISTDGESDMGSDVELDDLHLVGRNNQLTPPHVAPVAPVPPVNSATLVAAAPAAPAPAVRADVEAAMRDARTANANLGPNLRKKKDAVNVRPQGPTNTGLANLRPVGGAGLPPHEIEMERRKDEVESTWRFHQDREKNLPINENAAVLLEQERVRQFALPPEQRNWDVAMQHFFEMHNLDIETARNEYLLAGSTYHIAGWVANGLALIPGGATVGNSSIGAAWGNFGGQLGISLIASPFTTSYMHQAGTVGSELRRVGGVLERDVDLSGAETFANQLKQLDDALAEVERANSLLANYNNPTTAGTPLDHLRPVDEQAAKKRADKARVYAQKALKEFYQRKDFEDTNSYGQYWGSWYRGVRAVGIFASTVCNALVLTTPLKAYFYNIYIQAAGIPITLLAGALDDRSKWMKAYQAAAAYSEIRSPKAIGLGMSTDHVDPTLRLEAGKGHFDLQKIRSLQGGAFSPRVKMVQQSITQYIKDMDGELAAFYQRASTNRLKTRWNLGQNDLIDYNKFDAKLVYNVTDAQLGNVANDVTAIQDPLNNAAAQLRVNATLAGRAAPESLRFLRSVNLETLAPNVREQFLDSWRAREKELKHGLEDDVHKTRLARLEKLAGSSSLSAREWEDLDTHIETIRNQVAYTPAALPANFTDAQFERALGQYAPDKVSEVADLYRRSQFSLRPWQFKELEVLQMAKARMPSQQNFKAEAGTQIKWSAQTAERYIELLREKLKTDELHDSGDAIDEGQFYELAGLDKEIRKKFKTSKDDMNKFYDLAYKATFGLTKAQYEKRNDVHRRVQAVEDHLADRVVNGTLDERKSAQTLRDELQALKDRRKALVKDKTTVKYDWTGLSKKTFGRLETMAKEGFKNHFSNMWDNYRYRVNEKMEFYCHPTARFGSQNQWIIGGSNTSFYINGVLKLCEAYKGKGYKLPAMTKIGWNAPTFVLGLLGTLNYGNLTNDKSDVRREMKTYDGELKNFSGKFGYPALAKRALFVQGKYWKEYGIDFGPFNEMWKWGARPKALNLHQQLNVLNATIGAYEENLPNSLKGPVLAAAAGPRPDSGSDGDPGFTKVLSRDITDEPAPPPWNGIEAELPRVLKEIVREGFINGLASRFDSRIDENGETTFFTKPQLKIPGEISEETPEEARPLSDEELDELNQEFQDKNFEKFLDRAKKETVSRDLLFRGFGTYSLDEETGLPAIDKTTGFPKVQLNEEGQAQEARLLVKAEREIEKMVGERIGETLMKDFLEEENFRKLAAQFDIKLPQDAPFEEVLQTESIMSAMIDRINTAGVNCFEAAEELQAENEVQLDAYAPGGFDARAPSSKKEASVYEDLTRDDIEQILAFNEAMLENLPKNIPPEQRELREAFYEAMTKARILGDDFRLTKFQIAFGKMQTAGQKITVQQFAEQFAQELGSKLYPSAPRLEREAPSIESQSSIEKEANEVDVFEDALEVQGPEADLDDENDVFHDAPDSSEEGIDWEKIIAGILKTPDTPVKSNTEQPEHEAQVKILMERIEQVKKDMEPAAFKAFLQAYIAKMIDARPTQLVLINGLENFAAALRDKAKVGDKIDGPALAEIVVMREKVKHRLDNPQSNFKLTAYVKENLDVLLSDLSAAMLNSLDATLTANPQGCNIKMGGVDPKKDFFSGSCVAGDEHSKYVAILQTEGKRKGNEDLIIVERAKVQAHEGCTVKMEAGGVTVMDGEKVIQGVRTTTTKGMVMAPANKDPIKGPEGKGIKAGGR
jgi:hypothetical protein